MFTAGGLFDLVESISAVMCTPISRFGFVVQPDKEALLIP
jgi:hypothetical protein